MKRIGFFINPISGVGGRVGLKGSDGGNIQTEALNLGAAFEAASKTVIALSFASVKDSVTMFAAGGVMGGDLARSAGFGTEIVYKPKHPTTAEDTVNAVREMMRKKVDVIVFSGGDGTARDVLRAMREDGNNGGIPVIGIPTGVKIHSAVYAHNPKSAGLAISSFVMEGGAVLEEREVMDIDEDKFRNGIVSAQLYGYLSVPVVRRLFQHPKAASRFSSDDVTGIFHELRDLIQENQDDVYIWGTGSTIYRIMEKFGLEGSLLGVDAVLKGQILLKDATENQLLNLLEGKNAKLIVSVIGGQGHIFGRGNHQLSPAVLRLIGIDNIIIVASAQKIYDLENHTLYVDTSDIELDKSLSGYRQVVISWQERLVCKVDC